MSGIYGSSPMPDPVGTRYLDECARCSEAFDSSDDGAGTDLCARCEADPLITCIVCKAAYPASDDDGSHLCDDCYDDPGEGRSAS